MVSETLTVWTKVSSLYNSTCFSLDLYIILILVLTFKDKPVKVNNNHVYILLNKPIGYVTTAKDQFNRETVLDLIKTNKRIVPCRKAWYVYIPAHLF